MSETNVTAVFTPKPGKFEEVATLVTDVIKQVQEHETDTLVYYAFEIKDKNEIVIVERFSLMAPPHGEGGRASAQSDSQEDLGHQFPTRF
ncbi:hypothetical protein N7527_004461 [Penicillium freii]|nr:hypothetical protein N7527_004461 [Penicillium freii]